MAPKVIERIVAHADGWLPNRVTAEEVEQARNKLATLCAEAGRDPARISISIYGQEPKRQVVKDYLNAGADRVIVRPPQHVESEAEMRNQLEEMAKAVL